MHGHDESAGFIDWHDVLELVMSLEHWIFEGVSSVVGFVLYTIALLIWVKYHDRKKHNAPTED